MNVKSKLSLFAILVLTLLPFQNCGQVTLHSMIASQGLAIDETPANPTYLKIPTAESTMFRAAIMIDMSFSMIGDTCASSAVDMHGVVADRAIDICSSPSGVDNDHNRIQVVRQWIQSTYDSLSARDDFNANTFKILLVPFSGPGAKKMFDGTDTKFPEANRFTDYQSALILLDKLEVVQNCYFTGSANCTIPQSLRLARPNWNWVLGESTSLMGTSVPAPAMVKMKDVINQEIISLGAAKSQSRFEVVYISDGVPKPRIDHIVKAAQMVWDNSTSRNSCTQMYSDKYRDEIVYGPSNQFDSGLQSCKNILSSTSLLQNDTTCTTDDPSCLRDALNTGIERFWGDGKDNEILNIFRKLNDIKNLFMNLHPSIQFRQSFVRIDASTPARKTMATDLREDFNWMVRAPKAFSNNFRFVVQISPDVPFSLFPSLSSGDSYQLKHIAAVNLTSRVNSAGQLVGDSDSDGLFDSDEVPEISNTFPKVARSNGYCLDSITFKMHGCVKVSCDPEVDVDGDGLNECEEKTISTSERDFDTDDDGIPDGLEILFGYNPLVNDRFKDSNFDGINNYSNFEQGLLPLNNPRTVNPDYLSRVGISPAGMKAVTNENNETVMVNGYSIQLHSLPLVFTQGTVAQVPLYKSLTKNEETKWPFSVTAVPHAAGINYVYVIGKVENSQNPKDFYWIHRLIEAPFGQPLIIDFDLELMDFHLVPDPQWSAQ